MPHSDDCTCADCVDRLRHDHDRAQAQALEALLTLGKVADELRGSRAARRRADPDLWRVWCHLL